MKKYFSVIILGFIFFSFNNLCYSQDPSSSTDPFHLEQTGKLVTIKISGGKNKKTEIFLIGNKALDFNYKTFKVRAYSLSNPGKELQLKQHENLFTLEDPINEQKIKLEVEEPKNKQKDSFEFQLH